MTTRPNLGYRLLSNQTQALLIDVQERLTPHIHEHQALIRRIQVLIQGLQALNIPVMLNEQYKKGLGNTLPKLLEVLNETNETNETSFEKISFSVCDNPPSWEHIAKQDRPTVLLFGIETHVCVLQTALDLLDKGLQPVVISDAVGSRNPDDKKTALKRMRHSGVIVTSTESILFELCRGADNPAFKTISKLVK